MKILYFCPTFYPENSGYANSFLGLLSALADNYQEKDLQIEVAALNHHSVAYYPIKYKIHSFSKIKSFFLPWLIALMLRKIFIREKFDLIFCETLEFPLIIFWLSLFFKNKIVIRLHATTETEHFVFEHKFRNIIIRKFIRFILSRKIKYVTSTSSYHLDFYKQHYLGGNPFGIAKKIFFIIPNTILNEAKIVKVTDNLSRNEIYSEKIKVILLGRQNIGGILQKGFLDFIYAFCLLDKDVQSKFEVTIIGDGTEHSTLCKAASNFKQINFFKKMTNEEILVTLAASDISVLVSRFEGLSMFALESLLCKSAVIFTHTGGLVDLVENNGVFVNTQSIEQIAAALKYFVDLSRDELEQLKINSRNKYIDSFSNAIVANKFYTTLELINKAS